MGRIQAVTSNCCWSFKSLHVSSKPTNQQMPTLDQCSKECVRILSGKAQLPSLLFSTFVKRLPGLMSMVWLLICFIKACFYCIILALCRSLLHVFEKKVGFWNYNHKRIPKYRRSYVGCMEVCFEPDWIWDDEIWRNGFSELPRASQKAIGSVPRCLMPGRKFSDWAAGSSCLQLAWLCMAGQSHARIGMHAPSLSVERKL